MTNKLLLGVNRCGICDITASEPGARGTCSLMIHLYVENMKNRFYDAVLPCEHYFPTLSAFGRWSHAFWRASSDEGGLSVL